MIKKPPKIFKDPIYGYIEVQYNFVSRFIDTPCFQRLRHIMQTSYAPVYTNALHNRFSHSLGVYHLGKIAYAQIKSFMRDQDNQVKFSFDKTLTSWVDGHEDVFLAACLLHDVGHAPFSHTGEEFYALEAEDFLNAFSEAVGDDGFKDGIKKGHAKPHEYMSALVALRTFNDFFKEDSEGKDSVVDRSDDKIFFARCITGIKYAEAKDDLTQIKNCIISLLSSKLIDVDRLDYIIRDAFMSGYQNVAIDYNRLLRGVVIVRDDDQKIVLVYHKSAMSIIDNVIYAHDGERRWIQNQPVITYDIFLHEHCIDKVHRFFEQRTKSGHKLFSVDSLTAGGATIDQLFGEKSNAEVNIALLSDIDILFFVKNVKTCQDSLTEELFNRNSRRHPVWKSEDEYNYFFDIVGNGKEDAREALKEVFREIDQLFGEFAGKREDSILPIINEEALNRFLQAKSESTSTEDDIKYRKSIAYLEIMKKFSEREGIPFDFVLLPVYGFKSNFSRIERKELKIWYDYDHESAKTTSPLQSSLMENKENRGDKEDKNENKKEDKTYYYFYYKRQSDIKVDNGKFVQLFIELTKEYSALKQSM